MCIYIYMCVCVHLFFGTETMACKVSIGMRHVFSVECEEAKRQYILEAHKAEHVYEDVKSISSGTAFCYRCQRDHALSHQELDLFICGPSCRDMSDMASEEGIL